MVMHSKAERFPRDADPERNYVGGEPDPEDELYDPSNLQEIDEGALIDDLIEQGLFDEVDAIWFPR